MLRSMRQVEGDRSLVAYQTPSGEWTRAVLPDLVSGARPDLNLEQSEPALPEQGRLIADCADVVVVPMSPLKSLRQTRVQVGRILMVLLNFGPAQLA